MTNIDASHSAYTAACAKLDDAWRKIAGSSVHFVPASSFNVEGSRGHYALTPIHVPRRNITGGIALNLPASAASQLAATLFGKAESDIDASMRADVCAEISNILCSCVTSLFGEPEQLELGVTLNATHEDMRNVCTHNKVRCILVANTGLGAITLVVVDSFA